MTIDELSYKQSVPTRLASKARAKRIWRFNRCLDPVFSDRYHCYVTNQHWDDLTPTERIQMESKWMDLMLKLLSLGNSTVMHSIRYRLREQTPEEDDEEEA